MEIAFAFVNSQALLSARELGVFEVLGNESLTLEALAGKIGLSPVACRRLVMVLVTLELIERDGDRFRNTELGRLCSSASSVNLGAISKDQSLLSHVRAPHRRAAEYARAGSRH